MCVGLVRSAKIYYYCIEWDASKCSWGTFRDSVLGPTDPTEAPADSLRGLIAAQWKELGLAGPCDVGDNGVHASASPFEAMVERSNWLTSAWLTPPPLLFVPFVLLCLCLFVVALGDGPPPRYSIKSLICVVTTVRACVLQLAWPVIRLAAP